MMTEINENMSFEEMLDASFKRLRAGETTKGIVTSVTPTEVHLALGVKYTGIIPHSEMTMDASVKLEDIVKVGDEIEAIVIKPNDAEGTISLSKVKIDAVKCFDEIEAAEAADEILTGKEVSFKIISVEKARKRVVGSMRAAARVEREAAEAKKNAKKAK